MKKANKYKVEVDWNWKRLEFYAISINAHDVILLINSEEEQDDFIININIQLIMKEAEEVKDNFVCKTLD
jgi:hypothetical protein